jgi:hypothetical protein
MSHTMSQPPINSPSNPELRERWPIGIGGHIRPDLRAAQHVDIGESLPARHEGLHGACREAALG